MSVILPWYSPYSNGREVESHILVTGGLGVTSNQRQVANCWTGRKGSLVYFDSPGLVGDGRRCLACGGSSNAHTHTHTHTEREREREREMTPISVSPHCSCRNRRPDLVALLNIDRNKHRMTFPGNDFLCKDEKCFCKAARIEGVDAVNSLRRHSWAEQAMVMRPAARQ